MTDSHNDVIIRAFELVQQISDGKRQLIVVEDSEEIYALAYAAMIFAQDDKLEVLRGSMLFL